jgi:alpha-beta hydrolase superfamily lysophospholipase
MVMMWQGFRETSYAWRHQVAMLAEAGYHAVAIDQLGFGRSSRPALIHD